jgi:signal transduction histidine kinase
MRSVYAKILAWSLATLVISMALFFIISRRIEMQMGAGDVYRRIQVLALEEARDAYEAGGQPNASAVIARLNRVMGWHHYLLDARGRDLSSGTDRSALIDKVKDHWNKPILMSGGVISGSRTSDGLYILIVEASIPFEPWTLLPYYGLILLTVALLCWPLALHIGSPLRSLALIVDRFGQGDLSIRARSARRDEIGNLARSFDRMADRIETLLTAERRLLQDVSHELRSPLARLSFATELVHSEPDREKGVARIRKEVTRLSTLVGALLQMTRAEGDPASGQRTEFLLDELLKDLVDDCSVEAEARGCEFALKCGDDILMTGDRELIRRAIENVLRNAIQYSPQGKVVNVQLENSGGTARIEVIDQGPGVPESALARIFDPFFRADDSRTSSTGGMGLGLSIAMRAVRLHNGSIEAKNVYPGLLVTIEIPLAT